MVERAANLANDNNHEYVTLEHILLSLLSEKEINTLMLNIGTQPAKIKNDLIQFLDLLGDLLLELPDVLNFGQPVESVGGVHQFTEKEFESPASLPSASRRTAIISVNSTSRSIRYFFPLRK